MTKAFRIYLLVVAGLLIAVLAYHSAGSRRESSVQANVPVQTNLAVAAPVKSGVSAAGKPSAAERVLQLRPDQVLASVNGHEIKLGDVVPVSTNASQRDVEVSVQDLKYFLKRAMDRELIFQAAKERGLALNDSQHQQLANMTAMRNQPEPGGIARFNTTGAQRELELRDSEAFMLQTTLMAAQGASPNVTEDQVVAYYQDHQTQFGGLPVDEASRTPEWEKIDFGIRQQLAAAARASYNEKLAAYMKQVESSANIVMTPLDQL